MRVYRARTDSVRSEHIHIAWEGHWPILAPLPQSSSSLRLAPPSSPHYDRQFLPSALNPPTVRAWTIRLRVPVHRTVHRVRVTFTGQSSRLHARRTDRSSFLSNANYCYYFYFQFLSLLLFHSMQWLFFNLHGADSQDFLITLNVSPLMYQGSNSKSLG